MFFDWMDIHQDHSEAIAPKEGAFFEMDAVTGEFRRLVQPKTKAEGSYATSIGISVSGNRVRVSGNPSKFDRLDNLFGHDSLDAAVGVFNRVLLGLGFPPFTKCTKVDFVQGEDGARAQHVADGAVFTRLDITENIATGEGNTLPYLRGLSTQSLRRSVPRLHTNGRTVDWLSQKGSARMIYPTAYDKANEIDLHQLPKIRNKYGEDSPEYDYLKKVRDYCLQNGVVRLEQKLKSEFLRRNWLSYWGIVKEEDFIKHHHELLNLDEKLQVENMTLEGISEKLLRLGIVDTTRAANTTTLYAIQWMNGQTFDKNKTQIQVHRSRLRKIGIDICTPCDLSKTSPVLVRKAVQIEVKSLPMPSWYQAPQKTHLKLVE